MITTSQIDLAMELTTPELSDLKMIMYLSQIPWVGNLDWAQTNWKVCLCGAHCSIWASS